MVCEYFIVFLSPTKSQQQRNIELKLLLEPVAKAVVMNFSKGFFQENKKNIFFQTPKFVNFEL